MFTLRGRGRSASPPPPPPTAADVDVEAFAPGVQRRQRVLVELLQVHALSTAIQYETHGPVRVEAMQWWRELRQQGVAAVARQCRVGSHPGLDMALTVTCSKFGCRHDGADCDNGIVMRRRRCALALAAVGGNNSGGGGGAANALMRWHTRELHVDILLRVLDSLTRWVAHCEHLGEDVDDDDVAAMTVASRRADTQEACTNDAIHRGLIQDVGSALGDAGAILLREWQAAWAAATTGLRASDAPTEDMEATDGVEMEVLLMSLLLQFDDRVGSFHPFHAHKLMTSATVRVFRNQKRWSCSRCLRAWELRGPGVPLVVFHCAACQFTLCRECFTRIPNESRELQVVRQRQESFRKRLRVERFLPLALPKLLLPHGMARDGKSIDAQGAAMAARIAVAARARLQDLPVYQVQEMIPMMQSIVMILEQPGMARAVVDTPAFRWMPLYLSGGKMRIHSFLGPLFWWTSMSDELGNELHRIPDGARSPSPSSPAAASVAALSQHWRDGYHKMKPLLNRVMAALLDTDQDPYVLDATLCWIATSITGMTSRRLGGYTGGPTNADDHYDGFLVNLALALVHVMAPRLADAHRRAAVDTTYHEGMQARRAYPVPVEPLQKLDTVTSTTRHAVDDARIRRSDRHDLQEWREHHLAHNGILREKRSATYYPALPRHYGVQCDLCRKADFTELRYKCVHCEDIDICESCFDTLCRDVDALGAHASMPLPDARKHPVDHVFMRIHTPVPLIVLRHFIPLPFHTEELRYGSCQNHMKTDEEDSHTSCDDTEVVVAMAKSVVQELQCDGGCGRVLDKEPVYWKCAQCLDDRFVCTACVAKEELFQDPSCMHVPGHLYCAITRPWRQTFDPRASALRYRILFYPSPVYPRERFHVDTELLYLTIRGLHIGPLHSYSRLITNRKEIQELQAFCYCEEERVAFEREQLQNREREREREREAAQGGRGRRSRSLSSSTSSSSWAEAPPKLSSHYTASQARLADLRASHLLAKMHLVDATNVMEWLSFYGRTCHWLLELASPSQDAYAELVTDFSSAFSAFPEHFFFDLCDMVYLLSLDDVDYHDATTGRTLEDEQDIVEPVVVMLLQLLASDACTKNPHLRVQAARGLSVLVAFFSKRKGNAVMRRVFQRCRLLRGPASVRAVLQFHEDMEAYHVRNNGLVFNTNAGSGDHLLWGFVSIRMTTVMLLRFLWQVPAQQHAIIQLFQATTRSSTSETAAGTMEADVSDDPNDDARVGNQVSMLLTGLWSDAAKLLEESNGKVGVLRQLDEVQEAILAGHAVALPFRPSMMEGYIALHAKHLRMSWRTLIEVLELLTWMAGHSALKKAMLRAELVDQCARTTSFLIATVASAFANQSWAFAWHLDEDSKILMANLMVLIVQCAGPIETESCPPSSVWALAQTSGVTALQQIGDLEAHARWMVNSAIIRLESRHYLGEDGCDEEDDAMDVSGTVDAAAAAASYGGDRKCGFAGNVSEDIDENEALALLEKHAAQAVVAATLSHASASSSVVQQLGKRFVSALANDGRFGYDQFVACTELLLRRRSSLSLRSRERRTLSASARFDMASNRIDEDMDKADAANPAPEDYVLIGASWVRAFLHVMDRCRDMLTLQTSMDEVLADTPEAYLDPLLNTIMTDPVRLPSGNIVDRAVIERHLLAASSHRVDPFTREPLTASMLVPCDTLRREIQTYLRGKLNHHHLAHAKEDVLATWGVAWNCIFDVDTTDKQGPTSTLQQQQLPFPSDSLVLSAQQCADDMEEDSG